jgi:hypothetical protein
VKGNARAWSPAPGYLLEGSAIAPVLANVVGHYLIDKPFDEVMRGKAVLHRYADDILILALTPQAAKEGLRVIEAMLAAAGGSLAIHPEKGWGEPRDLRKTKIEYLGKELVQGRIRTPDQAVEKLISSLVAEDPATHGFRSVAGRFLQEISLDRKRHQDFILRELRRRSSLHANCLRMIKLKKNKDEYEDLLELADTAEIRTVNNNTSEAATAA